MRSDVAELRSEMATGLTAVRSDEGESRHHRRRQDRGRAAGRAPGRAPPHAPRRRRGPRWQDQADAAVATDAVAVAFDPAGALLDTLAGVVLDVLENAALRGELGEHLGEGALGRIVRGVVVVLGVPALAKPGRHGQREFAREWHTPCQRTVSRRTLKWR
jgi:hypothetical protein